jgi:cytidyltransferase-like protein
MMTMGVIWDCCENLARYLLTYKEPVVLASGGFDPLHVGHVSYLQGAAQLGRCLIVVVNGDGFLCRKKGFAFMPQKERALIVAGLFGVDHVVVYDNGTQNVAGAIDILVPHVFANGGDRSQPQEAVNAEIEACRRRDTVMAYGVGGYQKNQSSSELVRASAQLFRSGV